MFLPPLIHCKWIILFNKGWIYQLIVVIFADSIEYYKFIERITYEIYFKKNSH